MRGVVTFYLLLPISAVFGQNNSSDFEQAENRTMAADYPRDELTGILDEIQIRELGSFLDDMVDWASSAKEYIEKKSATLALPDPYENGRKLKYKKAELKFMMKTLLIFKVVLGLILPLGIIASKILSWKAVTLSLMAFMLAKILFIKNLLSGKNPVSVTPTNFAPPFFIHSGANDLFWKRQGEAQNAFTWTQT